MYVCHTVPAAASPSEWGTLVSDHGTSKINAYTRMGPFGLVPAWVLGFDLTCAELKVYIAIRSYSNGDDGCWPTMRKVAERANVTLGTARNAIQRMRKLGLFLSEDRYRADGSFGGFTYLLADVDPRLGDPTLGDVPKNSRSRAGTSADVPATNMDDVDHSGHVGGTSADVPPSINWCTPPPSSDVPIEQTNELTNEQTNPPPTPRDQPSETSVEAGPVSGGGNFPEGETPTEDRHADRARKVLRAATTGLAPVKMPSKTHADTLVRLTAAALSAGRGEAELTQVLGDGDLGKAKSVFGLLRYRLENLPPVSAPVAATPAPRQARVTPHAWVDGGVNGACSVCGGGLLAAAHRDHQDKAHRTVSRCEHGRIIQNCPSCRTDSHSFQDRGVLVKT